MAAKKKDDFRAHLYVGLTQGTIETVGKELRQLLELDVAEAVMIKALDAFTNACTVKNTHIDSCVFKGSLGN